MGKNKKELPVFFDQSGRRWRKTKLVFAATLIIATVTLVMLVPAMVRPVALPTGGTTRSAPSTRQLETAFNASNVPVFGKGQFIRAVTIDQQKQPKVARDVFSGQQTRQLTPDEATAVGNNHYALERYGQLPDRQIVLTFDDGPDPSYTPQLLDILSKHGVPASFFVVGANVVKHPEIAQRIANEGHVLGNHTFSHIDFEFDGTFEGNQEINQTERVITAATGNRTAFMRVPYAGNTDESQRDNIKGILQAQKLGYVETAFDYDTSDWKFKTNQQPDPKVFDGKGKIFLLHDSGGDRSYTLQYVNQLIPMAKKAGYTFVGLDAAYPGTPLQTPAAPSIEDKASLVAGQAVLVWPIKFMYVLFAFSVLLTLVVTSTNIVLAFISRKRAGRDGPRPPKSYRPSVTVLVPAYNEAAVLEQSVRSLLRSSYRSLEVVIIDDGSRDETLKVAERLGAQYPRVTVLHQPNRGKAVALNNGLRNSSGEIIISIDADTIFERHTVARLVRHFYAPKVGSVAGYVRVGNIRNILTRWQALEYITSIALERTAQAFLGAITVVPGACGAWRRTALQAAGGFSDRTLAEDCDVALSVHEAGYTIVQDTEAASHTECPLTLGDLAKQRFRWTFGNIQSYWKHRKMFFNKRFGWLGTFVLPNAALTILLPMVFWPLLLAVTAANIMAGRWWVIVLFPLVIMTLQLLVAFIGIVFAKESLRHLLAVPVTRLVYGPLRTYILYRSLLTALRGVSVGWNKVRRTKTVIDPGRAQPFPTTQQAAEE